MSHIELTARERAIVRLLVEGHTDGAVAERLGISPRTIAYTMRSLMDRLGVDNRFQLGLILGAAEAEGPRGAGEPRGAEEPAGAGEPAETEPPE